MEINVTQNNFREEVLESQIPVIVDFWATWCGPCRMLSPIIEEIAEEKSGSLKVCKCNVDEEADLAREFQIESIPTVMLFENGVLKKTSIGFMPKEELLAELGL